MPDPPPPTVWARSGLEVRPSSIAGQGLFTMSDIGANELMWRLGGRLVDTAELVSLIAKENAHGRYVDTIAVHQDEHLVLPSESLVHFANHSCDPNLWHVGPYAVRARRPIRAGEEVTIDYGTNSAAPGWRMTCSCATQLCRQVVTSDDWRRVELQHRYGGHWVPALAERIRHERR